MSQIATANESWLQTVKHVLVFGKAVIGQQSTGAGGRNSIEILCHTQTFDMQYPVVTMKPNTSFLYMASEALWVIEGMDRLSEYPEIERVQAPYSDDGVVLKGAYGPPFKKQLDYVVDKLTIDPNSRQAVMTIWSRNPMPSRDIPCTTALQFLVREDKIHVIVTMRSSDVGMGLPYDMFTFTCMAAEVASKLPYPVELGNCYITAGSRHIYIDQMNTLDAIVKHAEKTGWVVSNFNKYEMWKWPSKREQLVDIATKPRFSTFPRADQQAYAKELLLS